MYGKTDYEKMGNEKGAKRITRTALSVAYGSDNNRCVEQILNFMALCKIKNTKPFSHFIAGLVDHSAFSNYFAKCLEQNILMEDKLILKIK